MHRRLTDMPFETALHRGLGRAVLYLYENDPTPYRPLILKHCLRSHRYEPMFEDSRARYVFDLIHAAGDPEPFARRVVRNLASPTGVGNWGHQADLAELLARNGDESARAALYSAFAGRMRADANWRMMENLIRLDGVPGYLFVAEWLERASGTLTANDEDWAHRAAIRDLAEATGEAPPHRALALAETLKPSHNAYFASSRDAYLAFETARKDPKPAEEAPDYATVRAAIEGQNGQRFVPSRWGQLMDDATFHQCAKDLTEETDPERLKRGLRLFRWRPFPLDPSLLFRLVAHPKASVAHNTAQILAEVRSPAVRAFALRLLSDADGADYGLIILAGNPGPGDLERFSEILDRVRDEDDTHSVLQRLRGYVDDNLPDGAIPLLLRGYEETPCSLCRAGFVKLLAEYDPLPDWLIEEGCYDASDEVRELVEAG